MGYMRDIDKGFDGYDYLMQDINEKLECVYNDLQDAVNRIEDFELLQEAVEDVLFDIDRLRTDIANENL